jgi:hypothetical protein
MRGRSTSARDEGQQRGSPRASLLRGSRGSQSPLVCRGSVRLIHDCEMTPPEPLTRSSFTGLSPVASPVSIPPPDRLWSADEWVLISRGHQSHDMDDKWDAFVEADRLFLHRSWTGLGLYEAQFVDADGGRRISEAVMAGGEYISYRGGNDPWESWESLLLLQLILGLLLGRSDDALEQRIQQHRS